MNLVEFFVTKRIAPYILKIRITITLSRGKRKYRGIENKLNNSVVHTLISNQATIANYKQAMEHPATYLQGILLLCCLSQPQKIKLRATS